MTLGLCRFTSTWNCHFYLDCHLIMSFDYQTESGSPLNSNVVYTEVGTASPVNRSTVSYGYVATVSTLSPVISNVYTRIAVVSPLISNTAYSRVAISSPVINSNIYSIGSTSTSYSPKEKLVSSQDSSFEEKSSEGKPSGFNQSNSSSLKSNGSLNDSDVDRYALVGYNTSPTTKPCGRNNKAGWYEMHEKHVAMASRIRATVVLCGDSIIAGLTRYSGIWNKYFKPLNALNCGIGGDQTQHVLWRMENMVLPYTVKYIVVHCGTNNIDRDSPQEIANGVISCGLVLQENNTELKIIITGLLPRDLENSNRRHKIVQTNKFLKRYCRQFSNFTYMKQDDDWILDGGLLNEHFYYSDHLHLIETGNNKFAASIIDILDKLSKNEEIIYSSDENENGNERNDCKFERKHGETRLDTPKRESSIYESPFKLVRRSNVLQKRKRSLSPVNPIDRSSTNQKRRRTEGYLNSKDHLKCNNSSNVSVTSLKKHAPNRNWNKVVKKEYHGQFFLTTELKHDKLQNSELLPEKVSGEHLEGTVKSIDISLADRERREARKAKFGDNSSGVGSSLKKISDLSKANVRSSNASTPSASLLKIKSMEQSREGDSKRNL